jgi:hypothetical protein
LEESKKFTTKYDDDDVEKSTITKVDAKTNKTVEVTSIIDAKIDPTIKSSTKVLENQDYSHLDFGEPINYEFTNLMIRNIPEFEKEKKRLFENPETKHSVDNEPWITVEGVPAVAKIGDKIKVRFSKEIKNIDISIGNYIQFDRENPYDPKSKNILQLKPSSIIEEKDKKEIEITLGEIGFVHQQPIQLWEKGEYLINITCTGEEQSEQTQYTRIMKLHG